MPNRLAAISTFPCSSSSTRSMWGFSNSRIEAKRDQDHALESHERRLGGDLGVLAYRDSFT